MKERMGGRKDRRKEGMTEGRTGVRTSKLQLFLS